MQQFNRRAVIGGLTACAALAPAHVHPQTARGRLDLPSILARITNGSYRYVAISRNGSLRVREHIVFGHWELRNRVYIETYVMRRRRVTYITRIEQDGHFEAYSENGLVKGWFGLDGIINSEGDYNGRHWTSRAEILADGRQRSTSMLPDGRQIVTETERVPQDEALRIAARLFPAEYAQPANSAGNSSARVRPSVGVGRAALVIGAGDYVGLPVLRNPPNDARAIAARLTALGYHVETLINPNREAITNALAGYQMLRRSSRPVDVFYYAGHAVEIQGRNLLLPVDMPVQPSNIESQAIPVDFVLGQLPGTHNSTRIIILDACRNGPARWPGMGRGLAQLSAPEGTYVAYSTAPGMVAADGRGRNSPFTLALVNELSRPRQPIEAIFRSVRRSVAEATSGQQIPWDSSSLTESFYFGDR
jgi:hypothetical protein